MPLSADNIKTIYQNVLQRDPTQAETSSWTSVSNSGALTDAQIISAIVSSSEAQTVATVIRIYQAAFGRVPDKAGLDGWVDKLREGTSISSMVAGFVSSQEFANKYNGGKLVPNTGDAVNEAFLQALYVNVLGRTASGAEIDAWMAELKKAGAYKNAGDILVGFSNSPEFVQKTSSAITSFLTKAANGDASIYKGALLDLAGSGQTYALSASLDNITGTAGNDTIVADNMEKQVSTAFDAVDGGAGTDTFVYYFNTASPTTFTLPTLKNVENLTVVGGGAVTGILSNTGLSAVTLESQGGHVNYTLKGQAVTINNNAGTNVYNDTLIYSASDTSASVTLNNVGKSGTAAVLDLQGSALATANLNVTGASNISLTNSSGAKLTTVNISGDKALDLKESLTSVKTVNASATTAGVKLDISSISATNLDSAFVFTGGSGNDSVRFAGGGLGKTTGHDGGAGSDTLFVGDSALNASLAAGVNAAKNFETLSFFATGPVTADVSLVTSLSTFGFGGQNITGTAGSNGGNGGSPTNNAVTVQNVASPVNLSIDSGISAVGGAGGDSGTGAGGAGGAAKSALSLSAQVNNGDNSITVTLNGVTLNSSGGKGGNSTGVAGGAGGAAADTIAAADFETVRIVSNASADGSVTSNILNSSGGAGGTGSTAGTTGASANGITVNGNGRVIISGAADFSGTVGVSVSNASVTVDASALTGKLTTGTGGGNDTIIGGSAGNVITLAGGVDTVDISRSTTKADTINVTAAAGTTKTTFDSITGFTNTLTTGDKLDLAGSVTALGSGTGTAGSGTTAVSATVNAKGIATFSGVGSAATLSDYVDAVFNAIGTNNAKAVVFQYNNDTYVAASSDTTSGFNAGTDYLVKLTGVTGITDISATASGTNTLWLT